MTNFITSETGAVTVDWVVLTAGLVGLGLATMAVVSNGVEDLSGDVETELRRDDIIKTSFFTPPNVYDLLMATYTAIGYEGNVDALYADYQAALAASDTELQNTVTSHSAEIDLQTSIIALAQQQYDDAGAFDIPALAAAYAAGGKPDINEAAIQGTLTHLYGDSETAYIANGQQALAHMQAMQYYYEEELASR